MKRDSSDFTTIGRALNAGLRRRHRFALKRARTLRSGAIRQHPMFGSFLRNFGAGRQRALVLPEAQPL